MKAAAYQMKFEPIILKQLVLDCDILQSVLAREAGVSRAAVNLSVNRGYIPVKHPGFQQSIETYLQSHQTAAKWLLARGLRASDVWHTLGAELRGKMPSGTGSRRRSTVRTRALKPGDSERITVNWEVEMLSAEAMKYFKVFRNPFIDDVQKDTDIFMSDEHRYIEAAMLDAARHSGFLAVIGEVGSGKSVMRRKVIEQLRREGDVLVIYPQIVDKTRLTAGSICEAVIMDISDEKPRVTNEAKTRQVQRLLLDRSQNGYRSCLIIEEAHDLSTQTLKYLKRFYELEDGYRKLLGIVLLGQTELKHMFNESLHVDMREVIRRCQVAEIRGLNGSIGDYLALKFKRLGTDLKTIFAPNSLDALSERLTSKDRTNKVISHAYPLLVNNYAAKAMNLAVEMGEKHVTAEIIGAL